MQRVMQVLLLMLVWVSWLGTTVSWIDNPLQVVVVEIFEWFKWIAIGWTVERLT